MAAVTTLLCLLQTRQEFLAYYCPIQSDIDTVQTGGSEQAAAGFWGSDFATDYVSECLCQREKNPGSVVAMLPGKFLQPGKFLHAYI